MSRDRVNLRAALDKHQEAKKHGRQQLSVRDTHAVKKAVGTNPSSNAGSVPGDLSPKSNATTSVVRKKLTGAIKAAEALALAEKQPVKTSVLEDIIALNKSVGIEEGNARDTQIKALRQPEVPQLEGSLKAGFVGLTYAQIEDLVTFEVKMLKPAYLPEGLQASFSGNVKGFISKAAEFSGKAIYQGSSPIRDDSHARSLATSFSLLSSDPLNVLREIIENEKLSSEEKWRNLSAIAPSERLAKGIVGRYRNLKVTDSYKVTCLALELEVISEQIDRYRKDLKEVFENAVPIDHIVDSNNFVSALNGFNNSEEIVRLTSDFNEKVSAFLEQRNEIEKIQIQNYDKLTSAQKNPSIQKFKSEILSEAQFNEIFEGITLSGIQFEALREIESILINPESRSKPLVSFNMGEGKTFLIELVKKYAEVIERDKGGEEYRQLDLDEKKEAVAVLEFQVERHKEAIKSQKRGQAFTKEGTCVLLEVAKAQLKLLEDQLGKIRREVNQTRLNGLTIEIIDRANEAEKLRDLNAKKDLRNTFIFWDESRYGLQESSDIRLGSQLRSLKDKKANLVLVGATVNEIKLVEAVNRARDKGKTKQQIDKAEHDLEEFRKRKVRAINKISESDIEKETVAFAQNWAEIVKKNHGRGNKKSQHVFLDLKLELVSQQDLTVGLEKIIAGEGAPEIAMVNFIRDGEYRCLIAKKGNPDQIINTKVGNRDYYKAILQDSRDISFRGPDRELTAAEINTIKLLPFVDNIAQIYGERYSIGGVYDKVDVLQTGVDSQILYASKAEKINLAEIGQAQSRNRNSKPLKGRIVIQGDWVPQVINAKGLAEMALKNFEHRDLAEFVEDLDSKMTKYFHDGQSGRKCSEVLLDITLSDEEKVKIIGGDTVLMMQKFSPHIRNMESDVRHKFIRDVKLFIHYSSLLNVRLSEQGNPNQRAGVLIERLMLNYAPLLSDDYQYEFEEALLSQSSGVLNRGSGVQQALRPINILQANEQFIDHFSRLTYSKKTEACLKREREEAEAKAKEEKRTQKLRDAEEKRKQGLALEELRRLQEEADNLEKYLNNLTEEAEKARIESIEFEERRALLLQQAAKEDMELGEFELSQSEITKSLQAQLENVNKRIAEKLASEEGLLLERKSAVSAREATKIRVSRLETLINVRNDRGIILEEMRGQLQFLSNQSRERDQFLRQAEEKMADQQSQMENLKAEGNKEKLELDGVIAASEMKAKKIQDIAQSIKTSNDQILELYSQQAECEEQIRSFSERIAALEKKNKQLNSDLQKAQKYSADLEEYLGKLEGDFGELAPQEEQLRENLSQAQEKARKLLQDKELKQKEFQGLETTSRALSLKIQQAQQYISSLEGKISEIEQFLDSEGRTNQDYEQLVGELRNEIRVLESNISAENSRLEQLNEEGRQKISAQLDLQDKLSKVTKEQELLVAEKSALEHQIDKARTDLAQKKLQNHKLGELVRETDLNTKELEKQLLILEPLLSEKNQALDEARAEESLLRIGLVEVKAQIEQLRSQNASLQTELESLRELVSEKSTKIKSIEQSIESIAQQMDDIKQSVEAEEDIEKRTAVTAALLERIEEKQQELQSNEVAKGISELYSAKLRELSESLKKSFIAAGLEQERVRQERESERQSEVQQLTEAFKRDLESKIKVLEEGQSEKDLATQQLIDEMARINKGLLEDLLSKESLIASETSLKSEIKLKTTKIEQLIQEVSRREIEMRNLEDQKNRLEARAIQAEEELKQKILSDVGNQSLQASFSTKNQFLEGKIVEQKQEFDRQVEGLREEAETARQAESIASRELEDAKSELSSVKDQSYQLARQIEDLQGSLAVVRGSEENASLELHNMGVELDEVRAEKDRLELDILKNAEAYDQLRNRMEFKCEDLKSYLEEMQQQYSQERQSLEDKIRELELRQPEPDMEGVTAPREQLNGMVEEFSNQYQLLQNEIKKNQEMQERISELTAAKSTELEALESPRKRVPVVNMELAEQALAEQIRVLNLSPEKLKMERSQQHKSERQYKHVISGFKYADEVTQIVAPITPSVLSLRNFYPADETRDQRYYYIEFRKLTFQDEPKTAEGLGIFNDAVLYKAQFRNCKFHSIDFSRIDPKTFETITFNKECTFDGDIQLPEGFKLKDGEIKKSEKAEIPKPTTTLRAAPPEATRSISAIKNPRVNTYANTSVTLLGSHGGGGREEG